MTKHGKPVAKLVPDNDPAPIEGSLRVLTDDESLLFSTGEKWDCD